MPASKLNDAGVLRTLEDEGFRLKPGEGFETQYVDEHGHILTEQQLMNETAESVADLIRRLHNQ
jgi:hypothetical protein